VPSLHVRFGRDLTRALSWHRRLLAAGLAAGCVALALQVLEPRPAATTTVLVAARDLPAGVRLDRSDLRTVALPRDAVPLGALTPGDPTSVRVLAGPVRAGEPLTDARVLGPNLLASYGDDLVGAPVRVADPAVLSVVQVGDRIDVLAAGTDSTEAYAPARTLVRGARVVALPGGAPSSSGENADLTGTVSGVDGGFAGSTSGTADDSGLVLLAVTPGVAADLARAAVTDRLSVLLRGDP
jgi:pilus assembly protein CpaB